MNQCTAKFQFYTRNRVRERDTVHTNYVVVILINRRNNINICLLEKITLVVVTSIRSMLKLSSLKIAGLHRRQRANTPLFNGWLRHLTPSLFLPAPLCGREGCWLLIQWRLILTFFYHNFSYIYYMSYSIKFVVLFSNIRV